MNSYAECIYSFDYPNLFPIKNLNENKKGWNTYPTFHLKIYYLNFNKNKSVSSIAFKSCTS